MTIKQNVLDHIKTVQQAVYLCKASIKESQASLNKSANYNWQYLAGQDRDIFFDSSYGAFEDIIDNLDHDLEAFIQQMMDALPIDEELELAEIAEHMDYMRQVESDYRA